MKKKKYMLILRIIFIIILIYSFFTANSDYILACGIFAWVGKDIKYFRRDLFNILGMYNDSRGGDACGVYFDDMWYKGIGTTAKYEKLIPEYDLHNTLRLKQYPVIIGHDRKTSVGANTLINTQPIVLVDKEENIAYVHAHNGTIGNYEELAKKHNISLENAESDSIAIAKLIEYVGFEILAEYEGTGAFVMYFKDKPNELYAFHGKSKTYANGVAVDERPLAYLTIPGKGTYISSESAHLSNIANPKKDIKPCEFKYNVLYKLIGDEVIEIKEIDRSAIYPKTIKTSKTVYTTGSSYDSYGNYYNDAYYGNTKYEKSTSKNIYDYTGTVSKDYIRWDRGLYRCNDKGDLAHGTYYVTNFGWLNKNTKFEKYATPLYELNFVYGILMKDRRSFEMLSTFLILKGITTAKDFYEDSTFKNYDIVPKLKEYSLQPFHRHDISLSSIDILKPNNIKGNTLYGGTYYYDGSLRPILSRYEFRIKNGTITSYTDDKSLLTLDDFCRDTLIMDYDFDITSPTEKERIVTEVTNHWTKLFEQSKSDCKNCQLYVTHPEYCNDYCTSWKIQDSNSDSEDKNITVDKAYEEAYKEYENSDSTREIAMSLILSNFKELTKPLSDVMSTMDDIGTEIDLDEEVLEIIDTVKILSNKLSKY